jgi:hypothetical protein
MIYPKHFPDNCPPGESTDASGEFYRFIKQSHQIPQPEDFFSWRIENPGKECHPDITECQACGASIYPSLDAANNMRLRIPRLKKMKIAKGTLDSKLGKIKPTPSRNEKSHHTWWIPESIEPWKVFQIVDLSKEDSSKT